MKPTGDHKITAIGNDQPNVEGSDGERSASPISQFSPTPPPPQKPSPSSSIHSVRSTTKTTRSFVQTLKGAAKAATYAIGQGKPSSSKAGKAKEMDTAAEGERDITPTQHHATKAGDLHAAILAQEEAIFERVANWVPPNNDHLVSWDPLSGAQTSIDVDTFLGCKFKAAAYTRRYDIRGWLLYRHLSYPNTEVYIYLPVGIPLEEMQISYFLACCGLQIFPQDMRDYEVPACILKFLTNAGSEANLHWILAGNANLFIPVHRVGATDDDAAGDIYTSPELLPSAKRHEVKLEEAEGLDLSRYDHEVVSGSPVEEANVDPAMSDWGKSPATTYRTPSIGVTGQTNMQGGKERSMSPHRYLSPTPILTDPTPPGNQLAAFLQITIPFAQPVIPLEDVTRYSVGASQTPEVPDKNWHFFARDEKRNVALKGTNITDILREGVKEKKHISTPYGKGDNVYIRNWDKVIVVSREEYKKAGGQNGCFKSKTYGSNTIPDVP